MENLYDLSSQLAVINNEIIDAEGEVSPELERRLDETGLALQDKVQGIARWMFNIEGREDALDKEIARLTARKKQVVGLRSRLKEYVKSNMEIADIKKLEFDTFEVTVAKNPPSVEITDVEVVPAQFIEVVTTNKIDKKEILKTMKSGYKVLGAKLVTDKTNLRIK